MPLPIALVSNISENNPDFRRLVLEDEDVNAHNIQQLRSLLSNNEYVNEIILGGKFLSIDSLNALCSLIQALPNITACSFKIKSSGMFIAPGILDAEKLESERYNSIIKARLKRNNALKSSKKEILHSYYDVKTVNISSSFTSDVHPKTKIDREDFKDNHGGIKLY